MANRAWYSCVMNELPGIKHLRLLVKSWMEYCARLIFRTTKGRVTANQVTWVSVLAHIPVAYLIANGQFLWAAPLLVVFGLFDAVDGALARLSGSASPSGMVLDAFTDRLKEVFMYTGAAWYLAGTASLWLAVLPCIALGFSLATNFLKAKAEVAYLYKHPKTNHHSLNKMFSDGALSFEVRTVVFIFGVLTGQLAIACAIIAVGVWQTPRDMRQILIALR